jgi:TrpR family trp operon transcriptional repressor
MIYYKYMNIDDPRVEENIAELSRTFSETGDQELIESFLRCLLTPAEIADIAARWALVKALDEGMPQREIAKNLGLSLCKITRGSRELKKENSAFQRILNLTKKEPGPSLPQRPLR